MRLSTATHAPRTAHRGTKRAVRHPGDRKVIMVIGVITLLILSIVVMLNWKVGRALPPRDEAVALDPATLLPLAAPVNPIIGGHDMNNLPDSNNIHPYTLADDVPQPNVDLPLARWDWGTIPAIPPVSQTFPIQNSGEQPLLITSVVTSCGCTIAALSSSVIPPGQRADLKVTFDPNFHESGGPVRRLVWLKTNDPDLPLIEIRLDANVQL